MVYAGSAFRQDEKKVSQGIGREHTFYTSSELLKSAIESKGYSMEYDCPSPFKFVGADEKATLADGNADRATVRFSGYTTAVFEYDAAKGVYRRSQYGQKHIDANNDEQVAVSNVLILYAPVTNIGSTYLSRYDLSGGDGYYLSDGKVQELRWSKGAYNKPFVYTDPEGKELTFNPGKTWVCLVPTGERNSTVFETAAAAEAE